MKQKTNYEQVFTSSSDGIVIADREGCVIEVNPSFEEMLGYSKKELEGRKLTALLPVPFEGEEFFTPLVTQLKNKKTVRTQHTWQRKDGELLFVDLHTALLTEKNGTITGTLSQVRDVSSTVEIGEELKQRTSELLILTTIIAFFNQFVTMGELLDSALGKVLEIMKIESGALLLYDEKGGKFVLETSKGFSPGFVATFSQIDATTHAIGSKVHKDEYVLLGDEMMERLPEAEWWRNEQLSGCVCLPLKTRKRVYGMMIFGHRHTRFFSDQDLRLLKNIGYQIAISVENALLYKEMKESEEKYRLLTESANIGIISFTREGKIFQFNRKAEELFGFSREEIINDSVLTLLPATHHELIERIAKQYMASGTHKALAQPLMDYVKRRDGSPLVLEIAYSVWGERINPLITATIRDVR